MPICEPPRCTPFPTRRSSDLINHNFGDTVTQGFNLPFFGDVLRHAALPLLAIMLASVGGWLLGMRNVMINTLDRKSTRLNSSHSSISYAVFCLKKKTLDSSRP